MKPPFSGPLSQRNGRGLDQMHVCRPAPDYNDIDEIEATSGIGGDL